MNSKRCHQAISLPARDLNSGNVSNAIRFKVPSSKFQVLSSARRRRYAKRELPCEVGRPLRGAELGTWNLELRTLNSTNGHTFT